MPPKLIDITKEMEIEEIDSDPVAPLVLNKEEEDKTPIVEVIKPNPKKTQGYMPPPHVQRAPVKENYKEETDTQPSPAVKAAMVGLIAVILASPMFKSLLEKVLPSLSTGYMFYLFVFMLAAVMFMFGSRLV
jgi:hypothetical protein